MSGKRKEKDMLSNETTNKKSKTESKRKRTPPTPSTNEPTNNEYFKEISSNLDNLELNKTNLTEM